MKFSIIKTFAVLGAVLLQSYERIDEASNSSLSDKGKVSLEFDNVFAGSELVLGNANTAPTGEMVKVSQIKYIISNIVLIKGDGTQYAYPKSESYFIVDETRPESLSILLEGIPPGSYAKIKFGIGVDKAQFDMGATGQGDFLAKAQAADLIWSWSAGYKFLALEGSFSAGATSKEMPYMIHTGRTGTDYNYRDLTLDLPSDADVKSGSVAKIGVSADVSKITGGANKIILADHDEMGMGAMIMGGAALPLITANLADVFHVRSVGSK